MLSKEDKKGNENENEETEPTPLDQLQSTVESLNKSVPDLAKMLPVDVLLSREDLTWGGNDSGDDMD